MKVVSVEDEVSTCTGAAIATERIASPITAQSGVNDEGMVVEMRSSVAGVVVGEERHGSTPARWVGVAIGDVLGDFRAGEEPDGDTGMVPEVGEDTSGHHVEAMAEAVAATLSVRAAGVVTV